MPLYCYICDDCGTKWEDFRPVDSSYPDCECGSDKVRRNYGAETKVVFDDIAPYFDCSIGQHISGRRDKVEKYRAGGYTMVGGGHGCEITTSGRRFYGDEEYKEKVLDGAPETYFDKKYKEAIAKGIESPGPEDEKDGTLIV